MPFYLFGGDRPWSPTDWTSSDDRVRGGASHSYLSCSPSSPIAIFHGTLDTTTLGGAGFASQRTTGDDRVWDLSAYDGLELHIDRADGKLYTITVKDELLPRRADGRERSTLSWEYNFRAAGAVVVVVAVRWEEFRATYRGREEKQPARKLDLRSVRRVGIMMRSFFGTQEGNFSLSMVSIAALEKKEREERLPIGQ